MHNFPDAYTAYQDMQEAIGKVDDRGYQDMPEVAYQKWLKSVEMEKQKQASKEMNERMKKEIDRLKSLKINLKNNTKQ